MSDQCERVNYKVLRSHKVTLRELTRIQGEPMSIVIRQLIRESALAQGILQDIVADKSNPSAYSQENRNIPGHTRRDANQIVIKGNKKE